MKIYGNEKTSLTLTKEAYAIYSDTDPLEIREKENGLYDVRGILEADDLTESEVNELLLSLNAE